MDEQTAGTDSAETATFTGAGDHGETTLSDDVPIGKGAPRIAASGECEEAGALLGIAISLGPEMSNDMVRLLVRVQNDLIDASADISTLYGGEHSDNGVVRIDQAYLDRLERACDYFSAELPPPDSVVVHGGTTSAATLFHARTVVRRAERTTQVALEQERMNPLTGTYLNRLGTLLLILARQANVEHGDSLWQPGLSARLDGTELWEALPEPSPEE